MSCDCERQSHLHKQLSCDCERQAQCMNRPSQASPDLAEAGQVSPEQAKPVQAQPSQPKPSRTSNETCIRESICKYNRLYINTHRVDTKRRPEIIRQIPGISNGVVMN